MKEKKSQAIFSIKWENKSMIKYKKYTYKLTCMHVHTNKHPPTNNRPNYHQFKECNRSTIMHTQKRIFRREQKATATNPNCPIEIRFCFVCFWHSTNSFVATTIILLYATKISGHFEIDSEKVIERARGEKQNDQQITTRFKFY